MSRLVSGREYARRALSRVVLIVATFAATIAAVAPGQATAARHMMVGAQAHVLWGGVSNDEMDRQLDAMKRAHMTIARVDVGWASIEQDGKGDISNWFVDRLDHLVDGANARGIKLLLTYWSTPCWASSAPSSLKDGCRGSWWDRGVQYYPPKRASDYADSLAWAIKRYGDRVYAWEVWNEPNQDYFWHTDDPVGDYADMLRAAYRAAKDADPRSIIVGGSLSDSDFEWTDAAYKRGVKGYFDAWAVHPYSADRDPLDTDVESPRYSLRSGVPAVRKVMVDHGDPKPIWLTEFGWSTCDVRGHASWENGVSEDRQADYLKRAFLEMRKWSYVPVATWYNLKNTSSDPGSHLGNFGLLTEDNREKPAFDVFRDFAQKFAEGAGGGSDGGGDDSSPPPVQQPPSKQPSARHRVRPVVRAERGRRYVVVRGRAPKRKVARLLLYRQDDRSGVFKRHATYRWWFATGRHGRFKLRLYGRPLKSGTWRVVIRPTSGERWRAASTVLRG